MKLLVDIGNQRLKWAIADAGNQLPEGTHNAGCGAFEFNNANNIGRATLAKRWARLARPDSVWVSCVAKPTARQALTAHARAAWSLRPVFIAASRRQAGIVNGYPNPTALGSDRWAALAAAGGMFPRQPVIVVDAGTAVTVDLLDAAGQFRGGVIFPGIHTMQAALSAQTENIAMGATTNAAASAAAGDAGEQGSPVNATATDTASAVANGALLAVTGGINLAIERQQQTLRDGQSGACHVIATGGDGGRVAPLLATAAWVVPQLVLRGLAVISMESGSLDSDVAEWAR